MTTTATHKTTRDAGKQTQRKKSLKKVIFDFLSGRILIRQEVVRQLPYIVFLTVLAFIYIGNQYHAEKIAIETGKLKREIKELRSKSISVSSELLYTTNQIEIGKLLRRQGLELQQATEPPVRIVIEDKTANKSKDVD